MEPAEEAEEASEEKIEPDETENKPESECSQPWDIEYKPGQYLTTTNTSSALSITEPSEYLTGRVVHLHFESCSEELVRQQFYAIKTQPGQQNAKYFASSSLVLYGIRAPILGPFRAWKPTILLT